MLAHLMLWAMAAQVLPNLYHDEWYGDAPFLWQKGWTALLNGKDLSGWKPVEAKGEPWFTSPAVRWRRIFGPSRLVAERGPGDRIVNGATGRAANLVTEAKFGDFELYLEFMLARGSNSGVYVHGLYEIQLFDSQGYDGPLQVGDSGGIYEMGDGSGGSPPLRNASRAPGEWQTLHVWFQAPRFQAGRKTGNAKILRVMLNGTLVQNGYELPGPTRGGMNLPEAGENPIMLQGDHGPVAFRNIAVRSFSQKR